MRGVLIYARFDMKHIQSTLSNIKNDLGNVAACSQGGDEPKKLFNDSGWPKVQQLLIEKTPKLH
jgi:hypothetical protein